MKDDVKISKQYTVGDWKKLRQKLMDGEADWSEGFKVFEDRIQSRFLEPIRKIQSEGENVGEGFSIALISVILLEFLAAFELGKIYKFESKSPNVYSSSSNLLTSFFKKSNLFNSRIKNRNAKDNFYKNIRCGLVHEARTKGNDIIISKSSQKNTQPNFFYFEDDGEYRLNRDLLIELLKDYISEYQLKITTESNKSYRKTFLMKMDGLAGIEHVWYFICGSNLNEEQLNHRLSQLSDIYLFKQKCSLENYQFCYNKKSFDGTSKANLMENDGSITHGIAVLMLKATFAKFIKKFEKGYEEYEVEVKYDTGDSINSEGKFRAITCISTQLTDVRPSNEYVMKIIEGAKQNGLPQKYIDENIHHQ